MKDQAPTVYFLMETRLDKEGFKQHCGDLSFPNQVIVKKPNSGGGLALLWKEEIDLHIQTCTLHHIDALILDNLTKSWRLTGF